MSSTGGRASTRCFCFAITKIDQMHKYCSPTNVIQCLCSGFHMVPPPRSPSSHRPSLELQPSEAVGIRCFKLQASCSDNAVLEMKMDLAFPPPLDFWKFMSFFLGS